MLRLDTEELRFAEVAVVLSWLLLTCEEDLTAVLDLSAEAVRFLTALPLAAVLRFADACTVGVEYQLDE